MAAYIVFGVVMLTCVVIFTLLWRKRKSKKAQFLGDEILNHSSSVSDILDNI